MDEGKDSAPSQWPLREDVASTLFSTITGNLIQQKFIAEYDAAPKIGLSMVDSFSSKLKTDTLTGFTALDHPDRKVLEGQDYPHSLSFSDKYVEARDPSKTGEYIAITEETITYDQTNMVIQKAQQIAEAMADFQEFKIIGGMFDAFYVASPAAGVYWPSGSVNDLYATGDGNSNYVTGSSTNLTIANGVTAIQTARNKFADMTDDSIAGKPFTQTPNAILAGDKDADNLNSILNSEFFPASGTNASARNPLKSTRHAYNVFTSPWVDWFRASGTYTKVVAAAWLLGDFKKQYTYKSVFPLQSFLIDGAGQLPSRLKDVIFVFLVREKGDIYALDHRRTVYVKGAA